MKIQGLCLQIKTFKTVKAEHKKSLGPFWAWVPVWLLLPHVHEASPGYLLKGNCKRDEASSLRSPIYTPSVHLWKVCFSYSALRLIWPVSPLGSGKEVYPWTQWLQNLCSVPTSYQGRSWMSTILLSNTLYILVEIYVWPYFTLHIKIFISEIGLLGLAHYLSGSSTGSRLLLLELVANILIILLLMMLPELWIRQLSWWWM